MSGSDSNTRQMPIITRARSPSQDPTKRSNSPHHIASQALAPSVSRKPVDSNNHHGNKNENMYKFDDVSPAPSARSSAIDLEMDPQVKLENYEWSELEDQFAKRMEAFRAEEDGIWDEWKGWGEIFKAWASTISVHDEERAAKRYALAAPSLRFSIDAKLAARLRTRIAFTQGSEESLEAKRQHCEYQLELQMELFLTSTTRHQGRSSIRECITAAGQSSLCTQFYMTLASLEKFCLIHVWRLVEYKDTWTQWIVVSL